MTTTTYLGAGGPFGAPEALATLLLLWLCATTYLAPHYARRLEARVRRLALSRRNRRAVRRHAAHVHPAYRRPAEVRA